MLYALNFKNERLKNEMKWQKKNDSCVDNIIETCLNKKLTAALAQDDFFRRKKNQTKKKDKIK